MPLAPLAARCADAGVACLGALDDVVLSRPYALWALAVAVPVLAAHLYRRRRRRLDVAFAPLLREAIGPVHARGAWRRLRDLARLACRVLAVAALALAIAGPKPARAAAPIEDLVIVLDADETTSCREPPGGPLEGTTRFDRQVALAKAHVLAHAEGRVGVVLAAASPTTVVAPTEDRAAVLAGLDDARVVETRPERADLAAAMDVARAARTTGRTLRVLVVSSRELSESARSTDVRVVGAGSADDDQGIVDLAVERSTDGAKTDLRVVVHNYATEPRTGRLEVRGRDAVSLPNPTTSEQLSKDGPPYFWERLGGPLGRFVGFSERVATRDVGIPASGDVEVRFESIEGVDRFLRVELAPVTAVRPEPGTADAPAVSSGAPDGGAARLDDWSGNDAVVVHVAARRRPSVLVVHGGTPRSFLRALLVAMGDAIDRDASGFVALEKLADAHPRDVTILDGVAPPRGAMRAGAWVFLAPFGPATAREGLPFSTGRDVREPVVWRSESSDPLLRGVELSTAYVARATTISGDGVRPIASVEGDAVVAQGETASVRWLAFGLDPDGSDLPIRAALPILLANAIRRMGEVPLEPAKPFYRSGEPLEPRVALGAVRIELHADGPLLRSSRGERSEQGLSREQRLLAASERDRTSTIAVAGWGANGVRPPLAPEGGPFEVRARVTTSGGSTRDVFTAVDTLDRSRDIRPMRPPSAPPAPAASRPEDEAARWLRALLFVAGALLLVDLLLGALGRRFVVVARGTA